jgi:hypothetical protein
VSGQATHFEIATIIDSEELEHQASSMEIMTYAEQLLAYHEEEVSKQQAHKKELDSQSEKITANINGLLKLKERIDMNRGNLEITIKSHLSGIDSLRKDNITMAEAQQK